MTSADLVALCKKHPISSGCAALSLLLAAAAYLRQDEVPGAEAELSLKSADGDRVAINNKNAAQLREQSEALSAAQREIEARLVRPRNLGTNTQYFYKIEAETGVKILDLRQTSGTNSGNTAKVAAKASYLPVGFSVSVQGNLNQVLDFLRQLEGGMHYARVLSASFSGNAATRNATLTLGLNLELLGLP
jgi:hypothetical protein